MDGCHGQGARPVAGTSGGHVSVPRDDCTGGRPRSRQSELGLDRARCLASRNHADRGHTRLVPRASGDLQQSGSWPLGAGNPHRLQFNVGALRGKHGAYVENSPINRNDPTGECPAGGLICAGLAIGAGGVIGVGVPAIISNVIDFFTGASPEQNAANNAALLDVASIVGGTALVPIVLGTGIVGAELTTNFVLSNPIVATEIAGGVAGRLLGGEDFSEPTLSVPGAAAFFFTGVASDAASSFSSSQSSAASGGFVLYPGKTNTNQLQSVYAK